MKKYTSMKTGNQSNPNRNFLDWSGLDLILKPNQLYEQITKPKWLDQMSFLPKPNQSNPRTPLLTTVLCNLIIFNLIFSLILITSIRFKEVKLSVSFIWYFPIPVPASWLIKFHIFIEHYFLTFWIIQLRP